MPDTTTPATDAQVEAPDTSYVRARDEATGHEVTITRHRLTTAGDGVFAELPDEPAVDAQGWPLPAKPKTTIDGAAVAKKTIDDAAVSDTPATKKTARTGSKES